MSFDPQHVCYGCFSEKEPGTVCPHCGFTENSERAYLAIPLGTILDGRYLIGKVLGVGGFGITYLGYDLTLDYKVAVKEYMPSGFATRSDDKYTLRVTSASSQKAYDDGLDKFLSEARLLAKFHNTAHIVSVQDFFKENNTAYFVMEYVDGESLKDFLDKNGGKVSFAATSNILMPVMEALSKVHEQGLIHRDISPDNISITSTGDPKLLDFGAARSAYAETKSVSVILKHGLAPIEQYSNHGKMGPWTDVYAMGATLYRSITGILPPESIERIHADTIRTPSSMGVAIPPYAEMALMKALAVNPENRFQTMDQFRLALKGQSSMPYAAPAVPVAPVQAPVNQALNPISSTVQAQGFAPQNAAPVQETIPATGFNVQQPGTGVNPNLAATQGQPVAAPKKRMSKGALAGIIIGAVALVIIVAGTIVAINVANNVKPTRTTTDDTYDGGHFGSKETSDDTVYTTSETRSTTESESRATGDQNETYLADINAYIYIPEGYTKNDKGFYVTSDSNFVLVFSEMIKDIAIYNVDDVEKNKSVFIEYFLGKNVVETDSGKCTTNDGKAAYRIEGEYNGLKCVLLAIEGYDSKNKPGCYFFASCYKSDKAKQVIDTVMNSIRSAGTVNTRLDDFSADLDSNPDDTSGPDVRMKFFFEPSFSDNFVVEPDTVWIVNNKNDTTKSIVIYAKAYSAKSQSAVREESKARFEEEFTKNNVTLKSTKTTSVTYNNVTWTIDTHDFDRFQAQTITALYPNGMVVCIHAKCNGLSISKMNNYIKDLERTIRLENVP